jgi:serine/threonine protein kinase
MAVFRFSSGPHEDEVKQGELLAGRYRVVRVIGSGGMGVVLEVVPSGGEGRLALKFLRPSVARDPVAAKRFVREAEAARRIESPHVVTIADVGELETGSPYLVMEYLEGDTLDTRLANGRSLPFGEACDLALQVAVGLAAAHATGVIHRDIKPANLYLTHGPQGDEILKIVDFGVSKILDPDQSDGQNLTRTQTALGSPLFMSPEQMRSARTADARADQWSLGAVLYRMLTGHLAFDGKSLPRICVQVLTGEFEPIATCCPGLPPDLVAAVERCLRVAPAERHADVAGLAAAIAPFAGPSGAERAEICRRLLHEPGPAGARPG